MAILQIGAGEIRDYHLSDAAAIQRDKMAQRTLATFNVPLTQARTWDALATNLPGTGATDDLGLYTGTWGTDAPYIGTGDVAMAGATTRYCALFVPVPHDFETGETLLLSLWAGMKTTIADTTATVDVEAWRIDKDGTLGAADICTTAATSINSLGALEKQFTLDTATITAGDALYIRVAIAVNDSATGTAVIGGVWAIDLRADLR